MSPRWADPEVIGRLLADTDTWAVVGLSTNTRRAAFGVARFLQQHGKTIVPVHPRAEQVHGGVGYPTLEQVPVPVDVVDVFVRSELAGAVVDQAVAVGARAVWMQLDVIDEAAAQRAADAGLDVVMDCCPVIEWARHGPRV